MTNIFLPYENYKWREDIILNIIKQFKNETLRQMLYQLMINYVQHDMSPVDREEVTSYMYTIIKYLMDDRLEVRFNILDTAFDLPVPKNERKKDLIESVKWALNFHANNY